MTSQRTRERLAMRLRDQGIQDERVLSQIANVPRHIFVDEALAHRAYEDTALPIGHNQTISQPFVVALMSQLLMSRPRHRVLEVGTGSGYQTAVLAGLANKVFSIERIAQLLPRAKERLTALGLHNVTAMHGDGYAGWAANGPYDGILLTAAPASVPESLVEQLAPGGRLIAPVGGNDVQALIAIDREGDELVESRHEAVRFVPLVQGLTDS